MVIVALHGFLGTPRDWDFLRDAGFPVVTPSVSEGPGWPGGAQDVILGYSMGGRLALQVLLDGATFKKAVLISTRVTPSEEGRKERDEKWAQRFERDDWETLMRDWDAQPLFGGHSMPRREEDFDRRELARQLREWSPAVLPPALPRLHELRIPTLWIAGARDAKYVAEAELAGARVPGAAVEIVEGAAHRVPWERPDAFLAVLRRFLGAR
jgi:2-succinyl-6-hydroxy-2,4-cyclohexadiene-1-carboxylate synthase